MSDKNVLSEGIALYSQKSYKDALAFFLSLPEDSRADNIELAYYIGLCYAKLEHYDDALLYLEQVVTSGTNINVGTDARIGNNLYMMNTSDWSTGSVNFGSVASLQLEKSNSWYNVPVLAVNANSNAFIEISTGTRVLGSYQSGLNSGDIIVRANQNIRLGTVNGLIYLNGHSFNYYDGTLYIDGSAYGGSGSTATFA